MVLTVKSVMFPVWVKAQNIGEIALPSSASFADVDGVESGEQESDCESVVQNFEKKLTKKCKGRKSTWPEEQVNDMITVICSNDYLARKLVFQNTKNSRNGELFKKVVADSQKACQERGETFEFHITQTRTKFKSCVSLCKTAAMSVKTSTGIQRFQDDKNLGHWFTQLFPLVKSRESVQPEQAIEPSGSQEVTNEENYDEDPTHGYDFQSDTPSTCSSSSVPSSGQKCLERNLRISSKKGKIL